MRKWIIGAAILAAAIFPVKWAYAQVSTILTTCATINYDASQQRPPTQDIFGRLCVMASTIGSGNLNPGQISVGTTATQIIAARPGRRAVTIINEGTVDVRFGNSGVTTGNGALLTGTKGSSITLPVTTSIFGIVGTGTQTVSFVETW